MAYGISGDGEPLFFFYDCEATGLRVGLDVIIEVAAVVHTQGGRQEFASLCKSSRELHPEVQVLTGLTKHDLRNKPSLGKVLHRLFDWIKQTVESVGESEKKAYIPVLAAHGGGLLDFPMLFIAVKKIGARDPTLQGKFDQLNLHYVDTIRPFKAPDGAKFTGGVRLEKFGLQDLHKTYFGDMVDGHRALADAKALYRIFSDTPAAKGLINELNEYIQTKEGTEFVKMQIRKFKGAIRAPQVLQLLHKRITYEDFKTEFDKSEDGFAQFLKEKCDIAEPDKELLDHFRGLSLD